MIHGGDLYGAAQRSGRPAAELLDFSANINPLGLLPGIRKAIQAELFSILHYPDPLCRELSEAIAYREEVRASEILCGNGGADLIYRLVYALRPQKALVTAPAFAEYEEALGQTGTSVRRYGLGTDLLVKEAILSEITENLDLLFLCNPNNPTGLLTERALLLKILKRARETKTLVMLDECFLDFVQEREQYTMTGYLEQFENLVILKSFTKLYAIPGLRLGYALSANEALLADMRRAGQPWAVGELARAAGLAALRETGFRDRTAELVAAERRKLKRRLEELGLSVYDGQANYLCFQAKGEKRLAEKLLQRGILIRSCGNYHGLTEEHYRVAVRTEEENKRLTEALKEVLFASGDERHA